MAGIRAAFRDRSSSSFSYLYLANVLGAMAGAIGSAFFFIELLGFSKTLLIAVILNLLIAVTAGVFAAQRRRQTGAELSQPDAKAQSDEPAAAGEPDAARVFALPLLFTSGLASLGMEVVWTRQFIPLLGPLVYAFAAMLAVYLGATALGSNRYRNWVRREMDGSSRNAVAVAAALAGGCGLLTLLVTDPRWHQLAALNPMIALMVGIGPFCGVAGFMTPMLVDRWSQGDPGRAGRAYAINGLGCILGPLLAGFLLLPAVGERWTLLLLALPFFGFVLWVLAHRRRGREAPCAGVALAGRPRPRCFWWRSRAISRAPFPGHGAARLHGYVDRPGKGMHRWLLVNGIGMTSLTPITKMMAHLPLASLSAAPRRALVLCFGMGTSFRSAMSWGIPVTVVELVPSVPSLFGYFHADGEELLHRRNAHVVIDDARRYMERTARPTM